MGMPKNHDVHFPRVGLKYNDKTWHKMIHEYLKRRDYMDAYISAGRERRSELFDIETTDVQSRIIEIEREIRGLGFSWFGEKRQKKRKLKSEQKMLEDRLCWMQRLRILYQFR